MDSRLKQRLIGAAVLLALAVIILPELLKEPIEPSPPAVSMDIPPRPDEIPEDRPLVISIPGDTTEIDGNGSLNPPEPGIIGTDQAPVAAAAPAAQPTPLPDDLERSQQDVGPAAAVESPVTAPVAPPVTAPVTVTEKAPKSVVLPKIKLIGRASTSPPPSTRADTVRATGGSSQASVAEGEWIVQVGSFSRRENAESRRGTLAGRFPTTVETSVVEGRTVYRVRVGPQATRAESERVRERLRTEMGVTGQVMAAGTR